MTLSIRQKIALGFAILTCLLSATGRAETTAVRQQLSADFDWKFFLGDQAGAEAPAFADSSWRSVNLPHDWSVEGPIDKSNPSGSGGGFFPGGIGWYRKAFTAPASWKGKQVSVEFDGVQMNATVYLNGHKLGTHPYGYTSFEFPLTPDLKPSQRNVLAVRVDDSELPNSRWYAGAGIYRHVRFVVTEPIHIDHWGVFVTTPEVSESAAKVIVHTLVRNESKADAKVVVSTALVGPTGTSAGETTSQVSVPAGGVIDVAQNIPISNPALWSPQTPRLYNAKTSITSGGKTADDLVTPFGIRSLSWSVDQGLRLNGKSIKLAGGSVHHDNGPLGAAAFDRAEERKVELLKSAGYNGVRTSHNPPSPAFLDACDRLGLLVLDEAFDVWQISKAKFDYARFFDDWWAKDIDAMVLRDRNHPSVIFWSIGNEIPDAWTKSGPALAKKLAERVHTLDASRPLVEAVPGATHGPNIDTVLSNIDVAGYNYNLADSHAVDHKRVPTRMMMTTEAFPDAAFTNWALSQDNPYILGEFVWTAMDYMGESGIGAWKAATPEEAAQVEKMIPGFKAMMLQMGANGENPFAALAQPPKDSNDPMAKAAALAMSLFFAGYPWHSAYCGDLDLTGWRKPQSYYRDILWNGGDRVYATVRQPASEDKKIIAEFWSTYPTSHSWTWPGQEGKPMQVEVYAGTESVRLYLNDKLIGEKPTTREQQFKALFEVPYAPGTLKAVAVKAGHEVAESVLTTTGNPVQLRLTPDHTSVQADGQDLSFVTVEALDAKGMLQPDANQDVHFTLSGPGTIVAVGNGDGTSSESYQGDHRHLFHGRALIIVRTSKTSGPIQITASATGLSNATATVEANATTQAATVQ